MAHIASVKGWSTEGRKQGIPLKEISTFFLQFYWAPNPPEIVSNPQSNCLTTLHTLLDAVQENSLFF